MPDITMCVNKDCPLRETCYRAIAEPKEFGQSYDEFKPVDGECERYEEPRL